MTKIRYDNAKGDYDGPKKFIIDLNFSSEFRKPYLLLDMIFNTLLKVISQGHEKFVPKINFCPMFKNRVMLPNIALSPF